MEMKKTLKKPNYAEELLKLIQSPLKNEILLKRLNDYHEKDIADALELLSSQQRRNCIRYLVHSDLRKFFPTWKRRHSICQSSLSTRLLKSYPSWIPMMPLTY